MIGTCEHIWHYHNRSFSSKDFENNKKMFGFGTRVKKDKKWNESKDLELGSA